MKLARQALLALVVGACHGGSSATTAPTAAFYVSPNGNDAWSGTLAAPNDANTDGPFATLDRARAAVAASKNAGTNVTTVQLRAGTYYLAASVAFSAADSGTPAAPIVYENFAGEAPVLSGGMLVRGWTNKGGNVWQATLPPSAVAFEDLFYNGARRLRPRLGGDYLGNYFRVQSQVFLPQAGAPAACTKPSDCSGATPFCNTNDARECAPSVECEAYDKAGGGWLCFDASPMRRRIRSSRRGRTSRRRRAIPAARLRATRPSRETSRSSCSRSTGSRSSA